MLQANPICEEIKGCSKYCSPCQSILCNGSYANWERLDRTIYGLMALATLFEYLGRLKLDTHDWRTSFYFLLLRGVFSFLLENKVDQDLIFGSKPYFMRAQGLYLDKWIHISTQKMIFHLLFLFGLDFHIFLFIFGTKTPLGTLEMIWVDISIR